MMVLCLKAGSLALTPPGDEMSEVVSNCLPPVMGKIVFKSILKIENIIVSKTILKILLQNTFQKYFENRK